MTLLIIYVAVAIAISFLCSVLEAVLLSVSPTFVATLADKRPQAAKKLARLKEDIDAAFTEDYPYA